MEKKNLLLLLFLLTICSCKLPSIQEKYFPEIESRRLFGSKYDNVKVVTEPIMKESFIYTTSKTKKNIYKKEILGAYEYYMNRYNFDNHKQIVVYKDNNFIDIGMRNEQEEPILWSKYDFSINTIDYLCTDGRRGSKVLWGSITGNLDSIFIPEIKSSSSNYSGNPKYDIATKFSNGEWRTPTVQEFSEMVKVSKFSINEMPLPKGAKFDMAGDPIGLLGQWDCTRTELITNKGSINTSSILTFDGPLVRASYMINSQFFIDYEGPYYYDDNSGIVKFGKYLLYFNDGTLRNERGHYYNRTSRGHITNAKCLCFGPFSLNMGASNGWLRTVGGGLVETINTFNYEYLTSSYNVEDGKICPRAFYVKGTDSNYEVGEQILTENKAYLVRPVKEIDKDYNIILKSGTEIDVKDIDFKLRVQRDNKSKKNDIYFFLVYSDVSVENDNVSCVVIPSGSLVSAHIIKDNINSVPGEDWERYEYAESILEFDFVHLPNGKIYKLSGTCSDRPNGGRGRRRYFYPKNIKIAEDYTINVRELQCSNMNAFTIPYYRYLDFED